VTQATPLPSRDPEEAPCGSSQGSGLTPDGSQADQSAFVLSSPCRMPLYAVDPELFEVMGAPMVVGRWLRPEDARSAAVPVVISRALATELRDVRRPTLESLLGSTVRDEELVQQPLVVVGVVGDNAVTTRLGEPGIGFVPFEARARLAPTGSRSTSE
jgi:hypothetical protein